jgi:hypothetical protein
MSTPAITFRASEGSIVARVDPATFDRRAVYAAAFTFIDRAFVRLEPAEEGRIDVVLREKASGSLPADVQAELEEALWSARLHGASSDAGQRWVESITLGALGASDADASTDAEAPKLPALSEEDLAAFDDPLGIAKSWEEQHRK